MMPGEVFDGFRWVSLIVAGFFIVMQIIILIDFAYSWNEDWLSDEKDWKPAVLVVSIAGYVLALVAMILLIVLYANGPGCSLEQAFIGITVGLTVLFTLISITERCEHGAILPSAVCTVYCYWVLYAALSENPSGCNSSRGKSDFQIIMGFVIAALSVAYAAFNASANAQALTLEAKEKAKDDELLEPEKGEAPLKYAPDTEVVEGDKPNSRTSSIASEGEIEEARYQNGYRFQLIMASAACYACMLLTDWGEATSAKKSNPGMTSVWIQIVSQWVAALLYTWSLVAPYVLTGRQF
jgi:hypothetical protein